MAYNKQVRVIAGLWRGRKIEFIDGDGLRPTPERLRETLFNWLSPSITNSICLDLFAGSGALGFEAASRGAKKVVMIEKSAKVIKQLVAQKNKLDAAMVEIYQQEAAAYLRHCPHRFDHIFLDPPYNSSLLQEAIDLIAAQNLLNEEGYLYLEHDKKQEVRIPDSWQVHKQKETGSISYQLWVNAAGNIPVLPEYA